MIPVADPDRAKAFYEGRGWRLDADFAFDKGIRIVQFTPPGSAASIQFGSKITSAAPGSAQGCTGEAGLDDLEPMPLELERVPVESLREGGRHDGSLGVRSSFDGRG